MQTSEQDFIGHADDFNQPAPVQIASPGRLIVKRSKWSVKSLAGDHHDRSIQVIEQPS
jgi:hypothetical protein